MINLDSFRIPTLDRAYVIGLADNLITIHSQQTRAICLGRLLSSHAQDNNLEKRSVCIVGGGIAGLTCALELLENGWADVTILERMPDLLAVQNGSDTRWVHPHIINWPDNDSERERSDNGILDWSASTASNVTYEIEQTWMATVKDRLGKVAKGRPDRILSVHVGVTYIHAQVINNEIEIEWIRDSSVRPVGFKGSKTCHSEKRFYNYVIFASGFGIEHASKKSYWRNEDYGQLHIDGLQRGYIVSGLGDGAISDLLRLTTKNFRPDRAISEIKQLQNLKGELQRIKSKSALPGFDVIGEFLSSSQQKSVAGRNWRELFEKFSSLKREDTKVFLFHKSDDGFSHQFNISPASFLSKLLLFILYRNGAFQYISDATCTDINLVAKKYNIHENNVIERHGVNRQKIVQDVLTLDLTHINFPSQPYEMCRSYLKNNPRAARNNTLMSPAPPSIVI